jgi:hypothetical protein
MRIVKNALGDILLWLVKKLRALAEIIRVKE